MAITWLRTSAGVAVRDLNKNGRLDPYEDPSRPLEERVEDLLSQMTLEEKAGMMFHPAIGVNPDGTLHEGGGGGPFPSLPTSELVQERLINHVGVGSIPDARHMAEWYNRLQALAESTRLGIPITVASDPRHGFSDNPGRQREGWSVLRVAGAARPGGDG